LSFDTGLMDLYIDTTENKIIEIFESLGFKLTRENNYFSAKLEQPDGRFHAMFSRLNGKIYCDFHFDNKKHWLFFGVDYKKKPKDFFNKKLRKVLEDKKLQFEVKEVNCLPEEIKLYLEDLSCSTLGVEFIFKSYFLPLL